MTRDTNHNTHADSIHGSIHGSVLGTRVVRTEDPGLLTGQRKYVADLQLEGTVQAVFVRSGVAHGTIKAIHIEDAVGMPGVVSVWTATELGVAPHHGFMKVHDDFARPPLAVDRVRFVGEAIAVVFAESYEQGEDAAGAVWAEIDTLPPIIDPETAFDDDAILIFPDHESNEAMIITDRSVVDLDAISDVVVRGRYVNQRHGGRAHGAGLLRGRPDDRTVDSRVWPSTQMPHALHDAARRDARPATPPTCTSSRRRSAAGSAARPACIPSTRSSPRRRGRWDVRSCGCRRAARTCRHSRTAAVRCSTPSSAAAATARSPGCGYDWSAMPAPIPRSARSSPVGTRRMSHGTYTFPAIQFDVAVAVTNTTPMGAYRGAGRPEATALLERLVDHAALELGIDPIELRERNLLADDVFPFKTLTGNTYDSGAYRLPLRTAADAVGYDELRADQAARRTNGGSTLLGIGVAVVRRDHGGWRRRANGAPSKINDDGSATMFAGTSAHGQGHQTAFAMLVSAQTGIPVDRITLVDGDTDRVPQGGGTGGSRSLQLGGSAVQKATEAVVDKAKALAASLLEADVADIVVDVAAGTIGVAGVPASAMRWDELAARAPADDESPFGALGADVYFDQGGATFPFGAHIAVVEVDAETGEVRLIRHVAVDDCGTVLNPLLVEGQQHGGIASGVGQALYEEVRFDSDGNPITSNFADYGVPSAAELPIVRRPVDGDAVAAQPARCEGNRRGLDDRIDAGRAERRHRRPRPPRGAAHRHALHAGAGLGRDARGKDRHAPRSMARAAGGVLPDRARGRPRRG